MIQDLPLFGVCYHTTDVNIYLGGRGGKGRKGEGRKGRKGRGGEGGRGEREGREGGERGKGRTILEAFSGSVGDWFTKILKFGILEF